MEAEVPTSWSKQPLLPQTKVSPPEEMLEKVLEGVRGLGLSESETDDLIALVNNNKPRVLHMTIAHEILWGRIDVQRILKLLSGGSTPRPPQKPDIADPLMKAIAETCAMAQRVTQRHWLRLQHLVDGSRALKKD